jgi:hypothetical protein
MSDPRKFKNDIIVEGDIQLPSELTDKVIVIDGTGKLESSTVTITELEKLSGSTVNLSDLEQDVADLVSLSGVAENSSDLGTFTGATIPDASDIKSALQALETATELDEQALADHLANATDAHDASAISVSPSGDLSSTDVQSALVELQGDIDAIEADIAAIPEPIYYAGTWDASTNTPTLDNTDSGAQGALYYVVAAGTVDFGAGNIEFAIGDKVVNNGTTWDKWDNTDQVLSVNGQTGAVVLDTDDISEGANLYHTDERAQDAVGTILVDSASIDLTYDDATPSISAVVLPAGVDHDQLANFVANEHVDHSAVEIQTVADSGLAGGGDITASRSLSVDIAGTTAETSPAGGDELLINDVSAGALRKITRSNFLSGIATSSTGDINESSFALANNQAAAADVTGLAFSAGVVRSFSALVSVEIDATADLFEQFTLQGINKGSSFSMSVDGVGDNSGIEFSITSAGQVQYTSGDVPGFASGLIKFRAITTSI